MIIIIIFLIIIIIITGIIVLIPQVVGNTTTGTYSYTLKKSIAFAYLPLELTDLGSRVEVEILGEKCPAIVVKEPLFDTEPVRTRKASKK